MTNPRTIHVPPSSDPAAELIQMCHWISGHFEASWLDRVDWYTLVVARLPGPPPPVSDYWGDEDEHIELSPEFIQRLRSLHNRWWYVGWVINVDKDSAEFEIARELYPTRTEGGPIFLPEKWLRPAMIEKYGDGPENRWAELFPESTTSSKDALRALSDIWGQEIAEMDIITRRGARHERPHE